MTEKKAPKVRTAEEIKNESDWTRTFTATWAKSDITFYGRMIQMSKSQIRWNIAFIIIGFFILTAEAIFFTQALTESEWVSASLYAAIFILWIFIEIMQFKSIQTNRDDIVKYTAKLKTAEEDLKNNG